MKIPTLTFKHRGNQLGLTLVELMVAMTLGLILMTAVIQIFIGSKQSYRVTDNTSRVQENGRYAVEALSSDIRMAGYLGCAKNATVNNMARPTTSTWTQYTQAIIGYTLPSVPGGLTSAEVLPTSTDVIQIQRASSSGVTVRVNNSVTAQIQITGNTAGFATDDILVISDCSSADVFRANSVSNSGGMVNITHSSATNTENFFANNKIYGSDAEVLRLTSDIYYVGSGTGACPANTLCRGSIGTAASTATYTTLNTEPLVDNVEGLTFLYGEDTDNPVDGAANKYVASGFVGTWANVVSVRYSITIRTPDANLTTSTSGDRRIRRTFSATVAVRNNIP